MTISTERYTKDGIETVLEFGMGSSSGYTLYYVKSDDVVINQTMNQRVAYAALRGARRAYADCGWEKQ